MADAAGAGTWEDRGLASARPCLPRGVSCPYHPSPPPDEFLVQLKRSFLLSSRDDDDINDVASMAGVNLSEESARILATNSELVGTLTRSCKDETFLLQAPLQRRILEIGMLVFNP